MRREVHVRFCERLGVRLPGPTLLLVFHETSLRRILRSYLDYYHRSRTHLCLAKDSPEPRSVQPEHMGRVLALPQVGGLHHRYERRAA
jgi:putative transposase